MPPKVTAPQIRQWKKEGRKIVCITAYDFVSARIADQAGVDLILVGDSLGNVLLGYPNTLHVSLEEMEHHTRAAASAKPIAHLTSDLPFGSYQTSVSDAVSSAVRLMKAGAESVKLEGAYTEEIKAIAKAGIPVMGHVGMTPQSIHSFGGHKIQGRGDDSLLVTDAAKRIQDSGAFAIVLELIPDDLAQQISEQLDIPTIGIGAGSKCDGQIQVFHDVVGLSPVIYKHADRQLNGWELFQNAIDKYSTRVRDNQFDQPSS